MTAHDSNNSTNNPQNPRAEREQSVILQGGDTQATKSGQQLADSSSLDTQGESKAGGSITTPQDEEDAKKMMKSIHDYTLQIAQALEKSRISEYNELLFNPRKLIWVNLLGGAARGVGIAIGFTIFTAIIVYVLQYLGALNLPIIGDFIADIVRIVQHQLDTKFY
ncbi:hypothetical protein PAALTS15_02457 [Paenibacillus alvei TS-15]|uniref:Uncharacterized protein n=1 Tax=Paenibacillus alvei TS-15 TaxID=1117108 RepID=S9UE86_PAEAL|nr:hypothetical protein PAALTS15_02457 [Paenibacillus alvei TS-15]